MYHGIWEKFEVLTKELVKKFVVPSGDYKFYEEGSEFPFPVQRELYVEINRNPTYYELRLNNCCILGYQESSPLSVLNKLGSHSLRSTAKRPYTQQWRKRLRKGGTRKLFKQKRALFICNPKFQ